MLIRFIQFWRDAISHPFAWNAVVFLFAYSFVINILFGHRTFWRTTSAFTNIFNSMRRKVNKLFGSRHGPKSMSYYPPVIWKEGPKQTISTTKSSLSNILDDNSFLHCLTFLSPVDILSMECVSKASKTLCSQNHLWHVFGTKLQSQVMSLPGLCNFPYSSFDATSKCPDRVKLFLYHRFIVRYLLEARDINDDDTRPSENICRLLIFGDVYDLSMFLNEHPGGEHILFEWRGKDATRQFLIANHSEFAKSILPNNILWDSSKAFGRKGYPQFVKSWL